MSNLEQMEFVPNLQKETKRKRKHCFSIILLTLILAISFLNFLKTFTEVSEHFKPSLDENLFLGS